MNNKFWTQKSKTTTDVERPKELCCQVINRLDFCHISMHSNTMKLLSSFIIFIFPLVFPCVILSSKSYQQLQLPGVVGPESLAFDCNGEGPYVGVSDGRILKWKAANSGWTEFATTAPHR